VRGFSETLRLGEPAWIDVTVVGPSPSSLAVDLEGDGVVGWAFPGDGRNYRGVYFTPTRSGDYLVNVAVVDSRGCTDRTGRARRIRIQ